MVVIELKGGLGNQLYQYLAAYYAMKQRGLNEEIALLDAFGSNEDLAVQRRLQLHLLSITCSTYNGDREQLTKVPYTDFTDITKIDFSSFGKDILLEDYFIAHQHIDLYREELVNLIKPNTAFINPNPEYFEMLEKIKTSHAVMIHLRHGDKVEQQFFLHGIVKKDYYYQQIQEIQKKFDRCHFFFFSDNIEFIKDEFSNLPNSSIVNLPHQHADILEFELMRYGKHFIIPNSTFSQLAAVLSYNNSPNQQVYIPRIQIRDNPIARDASKFLSKGWHYIGGDDVFADQEEVEYYAKKYYAYKYFKNKYLHLREEHEKLKHNYQQIVQWCELPITKKIVMKAKSKIKSVIKKVLLKK